MVGFLLLNASVLKNFRIFQYIFFGLESLSVVVKNLPGLAYSISLPSNMNPSGPKRALPAAYCGSRFRDRVIFLKLGHELFDSWNRDRVQGRARFVHETTSGVTATSRAMQRRCCCSSERLSAKWSSFVFEDLPQFRHARRDFHNIFQLGVALLPCVRGPYAILSNTERGKGFGRWNTIPTFFGDWTEVGPGFINVLAIDQTSPVIRTPSIKSFMRFSVL